MLELLAVCDKEQRKAAAAAAALTSPQPDWTIAAKAAGPEAAGEIAPADGVASTAATSSADGKGVAAASASAASANPAGVSAPCSPAGAEPGAASQLLDLTSKVEVAPVVIPPGMPLTFIYHIMQEQGLNFVPVIRQHGPLEGMVTRWVLPHLTSLSAGHCPALKAPVL